MPIGKKSIPNGVGILLAIFTILLVAGSFYFLTKSNSTHDPEAPALATAVITLKQDIVALKSQETNVAARAWPTYQAGLAAELKGDGEFAAQNYDAARTSYVEAIHNFKKSLEASQEPSLEKGKSDQPQPPATTETDLGEEMIKAQARKVYARVINEERTRLARREKEEKEKEKTVAVPPPIITALPVQNDSLAFLRSQVEAAKNSMLAAKRKIDQEGNGEAQSQDAFQIEVKAKVADAENNFAQASRLYKLAEEQYLSAAQERARKRLQEKERAEALQREVREMINNYQGTFERRDVQGLKALFTDGFTAGDEQAWKKFFYSAQDIKANVSGENVQIDGNNVEVNLAVRINYANHKGIEQSPLTFQERWALAEKNGKWTVVSRQAR